MLEAKEDVQSDCSVKGSVDMMGSTVSGVAGASYVPCPLLFKSIRHVFCVLYKDQIFVIFLLFCLQFVSEV